MGKPHRDGVCWACQGVLFSSDTKRVKLVEGLLLPVCRACWESIPVADRIRLAIAFRDRGVNQSHVHDVLEWVKLTLAGADAPLPDWLRGGSDSRN